MFAGCEGAIEETPTMPEKKTAADALEEALSLPSQEAQREALAQLVRCFIQERLLLRYHGVFTINLLTFSTDVVIGFLGRSARAA